jgi:hypothetical protein
MHALMVVATPLMVHAAAQGAVPDPCAIALHAGAEMQRGDGSGIVVDHFL